ncbi:hypothetical protein ACKWTF_016175 [Chironomus riparius]
MKKFFRSNLPKTFSNSRYLNQGNPANHLPSFDLLTLPQINDMKVERSQIYEIEEIKDINHTDQETLEELNLSIIIDKLRTSDNIISIKLQINDNFNGFNSVELKSLSEKCANRSIVILLSSKISDKIYIYWKSKDIDYVLSLKHYGENYSQDDKKIYEFIADFLIKSLSRGELGIHKDYPINPNSAEIEPHAFSDSRGFSLLLIAAELGNSEIVKILLSFGADTESPIEGINAQSLAWTGRHSDVLLVMAQANLIYPTGIDISQLSDEFKEFYKETEQLHEAIIANNEEKIKIILRRNKNLQFYFNLSNQSAAKVALDLKAYNIYEILLIHEIFFAPHEYQQGVFDDLDYEDQRHIRELHNKHSKDLADKHINILMAHSFVAHDVSDGQDKLKHVYKAYKSLSQDPRTCTILKVVAAKKKFKIIYDFNRDAVNIADPTTSDNTEGVFYPMGRIYIGAQQLLDESTKNQAIATVVHELCHFAVDLTYNNNANPYKSNDNQTMQEFEKINEKCLKNCHKEQVVNYVYDLYPTNMHHAELIVRVPHLIALYWDQPEKLKEVEQIFPELFEFHEKFVMPDMQEAIAELEGEDEKKIINKDKKISKLRKNLALTAVFSVIGVIIVGFIVAFIFHKPFYRFNELSDSNKLKIRNGLVKFKGIEVSFQELFADNSRAYEVLTSEHISDIFDGGTVDLSDSHYFYLNKLVYLSWGNLTGKLKNQFLNSRILFQNQSLRFEDLFPEFTRVDSLSSGNLMVRNSGLGSSLHNRLALKSLKFDKSAPNIPSITKNSINHKAIDQKVFNLLKSNQISDVLDGKTLKISSMIPNNTDFVVDRNFVFESQGKNLEIGTVSNTYDTIDDIIERTTKKRLFILSSEAGAGKTVAFQQLTMRIKEKYPTKWVSYIDLKEHTMFYNASGDFEDLGGLLNNILGLSTKNEFEMKIFEELYRSGNVILLWNGFDEISPTFNGFILDVLGNIHENSTNVQYVCTRPLYSGQLKFVSKYYPYQLIPFNNDEQIEFLTKFFQTQKVSSDKIEGYIKKVQSISERLKFNTPLMLKLIAEIHEYSDLFESENFYKIYEKFVSKKVGIWQEKSEFAKNLTNVLLSGAPTFDIKKIYQKYAIFSEFSAYLKTKKLKIFQTKIPSSLPFEEISRMGILYINNENQFEFAHKTFAEFFVAQFFIENFYSIEDGINFEEIIIDFFYAVRLMPNTCKFISNFLDVQTENGRFSHEISQLLMTKLSRFLLESLNGGSAEFYEMVFKFLNKDHKILVELLQVDKDETLYTAIFNPIYASKNLNPVHLKTLGQKYLTTDEYSSFISGRHQKGLILFGIIFYKLYAANKIHDEYSIGNATVTEDDALNFLEKYERNLTEPEHRVVVFTIISHTDVFLKLYSFEFPYYQKIFEKIQNNLTKSELITLIGTALYSFSDVGLYSSINKNSELIYFLLNKVEMLLTDHEIFEMFVSHKILHRVTLFSFLFENFWNFFEKHTTAKQQIEILMKSDCFGKIQTANSNGNVYFVYETYEFKIFHLCLFNSIQLGGSSNFVTQLYARKFNSSELQSLVLESNDFMLNLLGQTDLDTCRQFSVFLEKIFEGNEKKLKEFLNRRIKTTNFTIFNYFPGLKFNVDSKISHLRWLNNKI